MVEEMQYNNALTTIEKMNEEQLTNIVYAIKDRRDYLNQKNLNGFRVGDKVKWSNGTGLTKEYYDGEVIKINPKTVAVRETARAWSKWRISPNLLTKIEGDES
jgi:hypothetical protein